jgi:hypothetical protein
MLRVLPILALLGGLCLAGGGCQQNNDTQPSGHGGSSGSGGTTATGGSATTGGSTTASGGITGGGGTTSTTSSGGTTGVGGSGRGGTTGAGGRTGSGGTTSTTSSGGSGRGGTTGAGGSGGSSNSCTFNQSAKTSTAIGTVGIVTWSTPWPGLRSAKIDFGLDTSYGMTAPVDKPVVGDNTTLLLGMKQTKTYHYRITATGDDGDCTSGDFTITAGQLKSGMLKITATTKSTAAPLFGGFVITGQYLVGGGLSGAPAYILDKDAEYVWAYAPGKDVTGAVMDYAGTHMWINSSNVPEGQVTVHRVTMDGLTDEDLSSKFTGLNHQLTVLPDETVAFYAYNDSAKCEDIKEYTPSTGNVRVIVNSGKAQGASPCHINNIQYSPEDDTLVFSDLDQQLVTKIKRSDGSTVWVLGGQNSAFTGETWKGIQHGIHILGVDHFMLFNNNSRAAAGSTTSAGGDGSGSIALELKLDLGAKTLTKLWSYKANPAMQNDVMGDLQRLPNGNTVIAYSVKGVLHEVSADGTLLQELSWASGGAFGYIQKRATLYGPPPR